MARNKPRYGEACMPPLTKFGTPLPRSNCALKSCTSFSPRDTLENNRGDTFSLVPTKE